MSICQHLQHLRRERPLHTSHRPPPAPCILLVSVRRPEYAALDKAAREQMLHACRRQGAPTLMLCCRLSDEPATTNGTQFRLQVQIHLDGHKHQPPAVHNLDVASTMLSGLLNATRQPRQLLLVTIPLPIAPQPPSASRWPALRPAAREHLPGRDMMLPFFVVFLNVSKAN